MIFADLIRSEDEFVEYLGLRLSLNKWKEFITSDEINLLIHFLLEGLLFEEEHRKPDTFMLQKYLSDIDEYYAEKQEGRIVPKPERKAASR
ncbi:hypothetical protein SAMN05216490_3238 [Mucilaginibacter mallensis]|uniref:Uncharacterized protein n=1 Tax=Mucilaginibacter mallensis TaxID=652787 RepID=A0A1H1ZT03_MUCMA|nr:hypothetical protein [Mucilaginibacter mallensis]SDT36824.1 hypothetical protein SAMN05216490_3238 [Mucilaginibacter mallensis]